MKKEDSPLVSVIVPVYNVEKYLPMCVDSILNQTYYNLEVIIVDDGSTDNCPEICEVYAKKDRRVQVIHQNNGGLSSARNSGLGKATANYVAFVDGDDYLYSEMYSVLMQNLVAYTADISICDFVRVEENGVCQALNVSNRVKIFTGLQAVENLYNKHYPQTVVAWNKVYKRELFRDIRFPKGRIHEDEFVLHEVMFLAKAVVYSDSRLYCYVQRPESITRKRFDIKRLDALAALEARALFLNKNSLFGIERKNQIIFMYTIISLYHKASLLIPIDSGIMSALMIRFRNSYKSYLYKYKTIPRRVGFLIFFLSPSLHRKMEAILNRCPIFARFFVACLTTIF